MSSPIINLNKSLKYLEIHFARKFYIQNLYFCKKNFFFNFQCFRLRFPILYRELTQSHSKGTLKSKYWIEFLREQNSIFSNQINIFGHKKKKLKSSKLEKKISCSINFFALKLLIWFYCYWWSKYLKILQFFQKFW